MPNLAFENHAGLVRLSNDAHVAVYGVGGAPTLAAINTADAIMNGILPLFLCCI
jgi:hypothetical protein